MELVGITTVRNESDIIEAFVRQNLRYLDRLQIIVDPSSDQTSEILERLIKEGLPLVVEHSTDRRHRQAAKLTRMLRSLDAQPEVTHAFVLDADEFLLAQSAEALREEVAKCPPKGCLLLPWVTYVPSALDPAAEPDPLLRIRHRRNEEPKQYFKIVIGSALFGSAEISEGNHKALGPSGEPFQTREAKQIRLAHFPVRSERQLISKVLLGEWTLKLKPERKPTEGYHWQVLSDRLRQRPGLSQEELTNIAASYAAERAPSIILDPVAVTAQQGLRYAELIDVDLTQRLIQYTDQLVASMTKSVTSQPDDGGVLPVSVDRAAIPPQSAVRDLFRKRGHRYTLKSSAVAVKSCRNGTFAFHLHDSVIGRSMDLYGEWAEQEVSFIRRFLRSGDVVLDVGANIGTHTVPLANAVGGLGQIHAFEPQRLSFQLLCTNVALNSLDNVFAQHAALGTEPGFVTVPVLPFHEKANLGNLNIEGHEVGEQVPMRTIDGLMLSRIDFIKIDVEGMEEKVLCGGLDSIKRHRPILYVENNIPDRSSSLIRCLHDLGYRCWWHLEEYFNPGNYFRQRKNIFSKIGRPEINLLCLPEGSSVSEPDLELVRGEDDTWQAARSRSKAGPRE